MSYSSAALDLIASVTERFGYALPLAVLLFLYLLARYPDRLVGTRGDRDAVWSVPGHPLIGNVVEVVKRGTKNQFDHFLHLAQSCPPGSPNFSWTLPPQGKIIFLNHPAYLEHIQKTNFPNYPKGHLLRNAFSDFLGETGIFVADGEEWRRSRKMASKVFSVGVFRRVVTAVVHEELHSINGLLENLTSTASQQQGSGNSLTGTGTGTGTISLPNLFFRYTLSSFSKMAFGADLACLTSDPACLRKEVAFATAFDSAQEHINSRFTRPGWQVWERYTAMGARMREWTKVMRGFAREIIDARLGELERQEGTTAVGEKDDWTSSSAQQDVDIEDKARGVAPTQGQREDKDLLGLFMDMTRDPEELLAVVLNFIIAGRDTTAQSLSWLFIELFAHPEHIQPILDEISLLFPSSSSTANYLAYDDLKSLPYMQACLAESIRLHPPVPKNSKRVLEDDLIVPLGSTGTETIPPPVRVYKGEMVAWSDWVLARLPSVWGEDCASYRPSRFLVPDADADPDPSSSPSGSGSGSGSGRKFNSSLGPWKFHAFNGGPRLCLGMQLAYFEAMALLTLVLPRWKVQWDHSEAQVCQGKRPPLDGRTQEEERSEGWEWPPRYKSSLTHPCEDYTATFTRR